MSEKVAGCSRSLESASEPNSFYAYHDFDGSARLSTTLVHALAEISGFDVTEIEASLRDTVDPGTLDQFFGIEDAGNVGPDGHTAFTVCGYPVTIYGDGEIVVTTPTEFK